MPNGIPRNGTAWKIATGALALFVVTTGAMWGMIAAHDPVPRSEFGMFQGTVDGRLERIERKLDQLLEK